MTRLNRLPVELWDEALVAMTAAGSATPVELGGLGVLAQTPEIAKPMVAFNAAMYAHTTLPRRLVELVRLRIAFHNQCRSCMAIRYRSAVDAGLTEGEVCSLERPFEAPGLSEADKAALHYADLSSTDHLAIDDRTFDNLRRFFSEREIVELGILIAWFIGFGRMSASWDMTENLPAGFRGSKEQIVAPWAEEAVIVRG